MAKFNAKRVTRTKTINKAGGFAYTMPVDIELTHAVLTTFLEDKFYESGDERQERIIDLVQKNKPEFVAKLAIYARTVFNLRSVSHLLIGELAKIHQGDDLIKRTIQLAAIRPDDCIEICAYIGRPLPKQVKRGIRHALLKFSPYQLAKYKMEGKDWSMVDVFNVVHPNAKYASRDQKKAWKDLMAGKLASFDTWEVELSGAKNKKLALEKLIKEDKMGYMAVLRNLNNFIKYGISDSTQRLVVKKLTSLEEVEKSRQLPYRFYTAYNNVTSSRAYTDAISAAMDLAVRNAPELSGKTLIGVDTSGSMTNSDDNGSPIVKAAIFAATLLKANTNADVILYDTRVKEFVGSGRTPVIDLANSIQRQALGGGTETSLVFQYAHQKGVKYDRFIIISDNESWSEGYGGVQGIYTNYKKATGTDPWVYAIDIQGYGTKDLTSGRVVHVAGFSDKVLDFIKNSENQGLVSDINAVNLTPHDRKTAPKARRTRKKL